MKIIVIGCTHAGTAAIVNMKELYPNSEIVVYEKNNNISFLSCGIALNIGGVVKDTEKLFYHSPEGLGELGVITKMEHEVLDVDFDNKKIEVEDLQTGERKIDSYDKLVLTLGSWPIIPEIPGIHSEGVLLCKNYTHAKEIAKKAQQANHITVVGAGYIGVELVEAFEMQGKKVTLIDAEPCIMSKYLDNTFTDIAEKAFMDKGVTLALEQKVQKFETANGRVVKVVTNKDSYKTDLVILCIGFRPNTDLVKESIQTLPNGAIIVDSYMQTSQKDVFAGGDCCSIQYNPAEEMRYIPLATNAVRMGTLIAKNLLKPTLQSMGTQGTSGIKIYDYHIASTGMTEQVANQTSNKPIESVIVTDHHRPEFMPQYEEVTLKLVYEKDSHRIIGGQVISKQDVTELMNTLSVVIQNKMTVEQLALQDFFFQPHFNKPWSILNTAALQACK